MANNYCLVIVFLFLISTTVKSQKIQIQGELNISNIEENDTSNIVIVKGENGDINFRSLSSIIEHQIISISNDTILLSDGGFVVLPIKLDYILQLEERIFSLEQFNGIDSIPDIENNYYKTVSIGDQIWMAENLRSTKYNDGTNILNIIDNNDWINTSDPGYCWYDNDSIANADIYGALYNFHVIENSGLNVCPLGWHVPSLAEWNIMIDFLGGSSQAGGPLKQIGLSLWESPNTGATNSSGFTAIPGGYRNHVTGTFIDKGYGNYNYTSTSGNSDAHFKTMNYIQTVVTSNSLSKKNGYTIRCIRD